MDSIAQVKTWNAGLFFPTQKTTESLLAPGGKSPKLPPLLDFHPVINTYLK
jgi:hypothetical protein